MKTKLTNVTEDELLLLAEAELDAQTRQDLFDRLDQYPTQWRFCALAILETKSLSESLELAQVATQSVLPSQMRTPTPTTVHSITWTMAAGAMCAASLLGLVIGLAVGFKKSSEGVHQATATNGNQVAVAEAKVVKLHGQVQQTLDRLSVGDEQLLAVVRLPRPDQSALFVPVISSNRISKQLRDYTMAPLSASEIRIANQRGWNVTQQLQLISVQQQQQTRLIPLGLVSFKSFVSDLL